MEKIKIGLITCSNTTRILDCPTGGCIKHIYERKGKFEPYKNQEVELVGINSCNGCPTLAGHDIILSKVESLLHYGANYIHLAYCMTTLCPFVSKYKKVIEKNFPDVHLVLGSHEPSRTPGEFRNIIASMLEARRKTFIP